MYDDYEIDYSFNNEFYAYDLDEMYDHYMHNKALDMQQQDAYENDDDDYVSEEFADALRCDGEVVFINPIPE